MTDVPKPCPACPWISKEARDIIAPLYRDAAGAGQWFCCHVNLGTCWGAVRFGAAREMPK